MPSSVGSALREIAFGRFEAPLRWFSIESLDLQSRGSCAVVRNPALVYGRVFARAGYAIAHPAFAAGAHNRWVQGS